MSFLYTGLTLAILACSRNIEDEIFWFRMLHIWQWIILAANFTNLGGILSGSNAFFEFKDYLCYKTIFATK